MTIANIVYKKIDSPLGVMLAGSTEKGCCFLLFEDSVDFSVFKLKLEKNFKKNVVLGNNPILDTLEIELNEYFKKIRKIFSVPLDVKGTEFQEQVWKELLEIPFGKTKTYQELADKLDKPNSSRAVGNANGNNLVSIIVPCHRVIHKDKKRMGYAGGVWRKKKLLAIESRLL
ncbi:MAG: methylated-DNA--[protein]-cysteine S-methyltransferase [Candidatus Hodarchaeales archaeon]|jgi:AraC family transcriptional regulator of adaptative response/methylated-DNA-[protein]-cysteine methyltransferase